MKKSKQIVFSQFSRVEGDLSLRVEISQGRVLSAQASGTLFRGFEDLVRGREPMDAIVFLCRICGQCSAAHSAAAAAALGDAYGTEAPPNGLLVRSAVGGVEMILNHLAHFYVSFAGNLCGLEDNGRLERFAPIRGTSFRKALGARHILLALMGLLAGKWPNTLALQPGGVTRALSRADLTRAKGIVAQFASFVEENLLGCRLDRWLSNRSQSDVKTWMGQRGHEDSDLGCFVATALDAGLDQIGRGPGRFLSCGGYTLPDGRTWLRSGYYDAQVQPLDAGAIIEDIKYSWYEGEHERAHPAASDTTISPMKADAYTWSKAPRYAGRSAEVGPMARMVVDGDPLAMGLMREPGPSVYSRVLLRLHELVRLISNIRELLEQVDPDKPFYAKHTCREDAEGHALVEAPRGLLGHWVRIERSRIKNYQVVTPTGWNLSPRDCQGSPGPLEEALVGTGVKDAEEAVNVRLVVSSYDPCLYCSVH